jgi:Zn-dependent protease with chaperone function
MQARPSGPFSGRAGCALALALCSVLVAAQTRIVPPKNKYTPEQDVQLGRQAAAEARQKLPIVENADIGRFLGRLGEQLVAAAPEDLRNPLFEFSFTAVNQKDINAFALPGGPMFVNRGMLEAAARQDEIVGVMAHELAHVLLRHGTANMSKARSPGLTLGAIAGAVAGAIVGGPVGGLIADGSQFGLGAFLLKYSRDYEKQADLLGVQVMARAGYDPAALASMFETIQKRGGGAGPQWLSSHPNPGNRTQYILAEAKLVQVAERPPGPEDFQRVRAAAAALPAPGGTRGEAGPAGAVDKERLGTFGEPVPRPSREFRAVRAGQFLQVSVPSNWNVLSANNLLRFVPANAYGEVDGRAIYTHGAEIGLARADSRDLRQATVALLDRLSEANPRLRLRGEQQYVRLAGRTALATPLANQPAKGGTEAIGVYTTLLSNGQLFYFLTTVPQEDQADYEEIFQRIASSIRLNESR